MLFNKNKAKTSPEKSEPIEEKPSKDISVKEDLLGSFFKRKHSATESINQTAGKLMASSNSTISVLKESGRNNEKISKLIELIREDDSKTILPSVDLNSGRIYYPVLTEIEEKDDNVGFLHSLTSPSIDVLEKFNFERLVVCPQHANSFAITIRLYCPKCSSMNIDKLFLYEHSRCGYISEKKNYKIDHEAGTAKCPSCKKEVPDIKKELRVPAMWYECNDCMEKFDDINVKLFCRNYNHDFELHHAQTKVVNGFKLKSSSEDESFIDSSVTVKLKELLDKYAFVVEENVSLKGKSGHFHSVSLCGKNKDGKMICIYIIKPDKNIDNAEVNRKIIQVLDSSPQLAVIIGFTSISDKLRSLADTYNVSIIGNENLEEIVTDLDALMNEKIKNSE